MNPKASEIEQQLKRQVSSLEQTLTKVDSTATRSGLVDPVEPVESVEPVQFKEEYTSDTDGQDSLVDEVVRKSLKKKSVKKLKL